MPRRWNIGEMGLEIATASATIGERSRAHSAANDS